MKTGFLVILFFLFSAVQVSVAYAGELSEKRSEADQLYLEKAYKKAQKMYLKLARAGDHYSQGRLADMYANGEGRKVDLEEAYAWSVLAEQGGDSFMTYSSGQLLERVSDKPAAQKAAEKLKTKYGRQAQLVKEQRRAESEAARRNGSSMGSNLSR